MNDVIPMIYMFSIFRNTVLCHSIIPQNKLFIKYPLEFIVICKLNDIIKF